MFFSVLRLILFFPWAEWIISETMKNTRNILVFSSEAATTTTTHRTKMSSFRSTQHIWLDLVSLSGGLRNTFCPLVYKFHPTPIKSLSKWWQARGSHRSQPYPPGVGNICPKTLSVVKIFNWGSKWRISRTGRCHLGSLTAHSWAALGKNPLTLLC